MSGPDLTQLRHALVEAEAVIASLRAEAASLRRDTQLRVRNMLALVRSLARRTAEEEGEHASDYRDRLDSRLASFARSQSAIFRTPTLGVDLEMLVADELLAFGIGLGAQARVEGMSVCLKPLPASVLGLACHELSRMAVEGGGTFAASWSLLVTWRVDERGDLLIEWTETGRPTSGSKAADPGFGRAYLEQAIAYDLNGGVQLDMAPDGLNCRLHLPADSLHPTDRGPVPQSNPVRP